MASPHSFHEWRGPVPDTAPIFLSRIPYAFRPVAASRDSMVKMAS
jgi:hypothetical protein